MKRSVVATVIVIALIGLGVAAVPLAERHAAGEIKAEIERAGIAEVGAVKVGLFDRRLVLSDLVVKSTTELNVGRFEASGLDWPLGELLRGRLPFGDVRWGDPIQIGRIELSDARGAANGTGWSLGSLVIEGLDLARYDGDAVNSANPTTLAARLLGALSMARLEAHGLVATNPTGETFGVAALTLERYEHGKIGTFALANFAAAAKDAREPAFRLGEVKSTGLDLSRPIATMSLASWRPGTLVGRVGLDSASATGFGGEALARYGASIGSVSVETARESEQVRRTRTRIEGFVLAPPVRGLESLKVRIALQSMGLKDLKLGFDCSASEDRGKGEAAIERCALVGPELGEIDFAAALVRADDIFWRAIDEGNTATLFASKAALASAKLVLADQSLLDRSLKAMAAATGQPAAATRASLARDIRGFQPSGVLITQELTQLLDTVARFVERGGTLSLVAKPEPPLGFDKIPYFSSPGPDLVNTLGLSAALSP